MRIFLFFIIALSIAGNANAEVYVSSKLSFFGEKIEADVKPLGISYEQIAPAQNHADEIKVDINVNNALFNDITVLICSKSELDNLLRKQRSACAARKGRGALSVSTKPDNAESYYLVLKNSNIIRPKHIVAQPLITLAIDNKQKDLIKKDMGEALNLLHAKFIFSDFDLNIVACGEKNASSAVKDGSIKICSEIVFDAILNKKPGVLIGALMHELGHSLLNLWGLPNYDNERTADEFAVVIMLMSNHQDYAEEWTGFFEERNSEAEFRAIVATNDLHPLNIQRIAAIKAILSDPLPVIRRWNKLL